MNKRPLAAALLLLCLLAPTRPARAAAARLRPDPPLLQLGVGGEQTLDLWLENADQVYGLSIRASFDPAVVAVVDANPAQAGVQLTPGPFLAPDFLVRNSADNEAGTLEVVLTQVNPTPPVDGTGVVLSIRLRGLAPAAGSLLNIDAVEIVDRRGVKLPVESAPGTLDVLALLPGGTLFLPAVAAQAADPAGAALAQVSGHVLLQGRAAPGAASRVTLTDLAGQFAPVLLTVDPASGAFSASMPVQAGGTTYRLAASHPLYVNNELTLFLMPGQHTSDLALRLQGGDADNNGRVEIDDLLCVRRSFGGPPGGCLGQGSGDINGDGVVNVFDLVLAGANCDSHALGVDR